MMKIFLLVAFFISLNVGAAESEVKPVLRVAFFNQMYGNLRQSAASDSTTLTTISCGHPVKVLKGEAAENWLQARVGTYDGFIPQAFLSDTRPICFQDQFPSFFQQFNFEVTDLFYWGRLYDQYIQGRSKVR